MTPFLGELFINRQRIVLRTNAGIRSLSAADVYALAIHGRSPNAKLTCPAFESVPSIVFMSRPLPVFVWARNSFEADIDVDPAVTVRGELKVLDDLNCDHILVEGVWHPLDGESLDAARRWGEGRGKQESALAKYVGIYQGLNPSLRIRDDVDIDLLRDSVIGTKAPQGLQATLYQYQEAGYQWLSEAVEAGLGCLLADEMGLGKTIQVIALLEERCSRSRGPSVVVAPVTLIENWRREIHRFAPGLRVNVHHGPKRARYGGAFKAVDIVLASYETAARDIGVFASRDWDLLVLDEAQNVKNPDTQRANLIREFPRRAAIVVTGTPIENGTLDLWSLAEFAVPGYLGSREVYKESLAQRPSTLARAVKPLLLRRETAEVAIELPPRVDSDVMIEMFDNESTGYNELISSMNARDNPGDTLSLITKLRQFTAHPSLPSNTTPEDPIAESAKLWRLNEMLEEIFSSNRKALVFCAFRAMSDLISRAIYERMYVQSWVMDGRTPTGSRQRLVDAFEECAGPAALVLHPTTGGAGLNITAANHVIHYTLEWNPAKESQATARAYRRGQDQPVFVYRLLYPGTIDEVISDVLRRKREIAEEVIGPNDALELDMLVRATNLHQSDVNTVNLIGEN